MVTVCTTCINILYLWIFPTDCSPICWFDTNFWIRSNHIRVHHNQLTPVTCMYRIFSNTPATEYAAHSIFQETKKGNILIKFFEAIKYTWQVYTRIICSFNLNVIFCKRIVDFKLPAVLPYILSTRVGEIRAARF